MIVTTLAHLRHIFAHFRRLGIKHLAADTETQSKEKFPDKASTLIYDRHKIRMFSICHKGVAYSFPTNNVSPAYPSIFEWAAEFDKFSEQMPNLIWVFHNFNYDQRVMELQGFSRWRKIKFWDTMISAWLCDGNTDKSLKARAPLYGRFIRDTKTIDFSNLVELADYAEGDVVATDEYYQMHRYGKVVRPKFLTYIDANGNRKSVANKGVAHYELVVPTEKLMPFDRTFLRYQEFPVLRSTLDLEHRGLVFDVKRLQAIRLPMEVDLTRLRKQIFRKAGKAFNINAAKQKVAVLEELGVDIKKKTKSGAPSVDAESMIELQGSHPIIDDLMEYSKIEKLRSVYIGKEGLEYYLNPRTNRIHTTLNTVGAVTGRFSSSGPNCQQIPSRNDRYGIKSCFAAPKGKAIVCMDFSQVELRIMAMLSQDPLMSKVLNDPNGDIHTTTSEQLDVPRDPVAKQCNFLLIFGGGAYALQTRLKMEKHATTEEECQSFIDGFNSTYTRVPEFREECFEYHRRFGFIPLLTGRRRVIENIGSSNKWKRHSAETQLANNVVQGSAQDWAKCLIVRSDPRRPNMDKVIRDLPSSAFRNMPDMPSCVPDKHHRSLLGKYADEVEKFRKMARLAKMEWLLQVHDEVLYLCDKSAALDVANGIARLMTFRPYWQPVYKIDVAVRGDGGVGETWKEAKKPKDKSMHVVSPTIIW